MPRSATLSIYLVLFATSALSEDKAEQLDCMFTSAASVHEDAYGITRLENYRLPAEFFSDFSVEMSTNALGKISIDRWVMHDALANAGLHPPSVCKGDAFTITCVGHFGDNIFIDRETLKGSATIPRKSGYAKEIVVSFFRCNKVG